VVRGVVDARVGARDDPDADLMHGLGMLTDHDAGQLRDVRRVHVDGRADEDVLLRDPGGEWLAEAPLVGLGHERAVLERGDPGLNRPADALDAVGVRRDRLVDPARLLHDHGQLRRRELGVPGRRAGRHEPAGRHDLDQVGAVLVVGADDTAQVVLAVSLAAHEPAVPAGDGDRAGGHHQARAAGQAGGDGVTRDHIKVGPRAEVAGGGHAHAEQLPCVVQHQYQLLRVRLAAHPRGRIRATVEPEVDVAVDQSRHDRRVRVVRPRQRRVLGGQRSCGASPVQRAVADHDRAVWHGLITGNDPRRSEHLWHSITSPSASLTTRDRQRWRRRWGHVKAGPEAASR
jgi:hypothetical protein